jgi:hypothetical protein
LFKRAAGIFPAARSLIFWTRLAIRSLLARGHAGTRAQRHATATHAGGAARVGDDFRTADYGTFGRRQTSSGRGTFDGFDLRVSGARRKQHVVGSGADGERGQRDRAESKEDFRFHIFLLDVWAWLESCARCFRFNPLTPWRKKPRKLSLKNFCGIFRRPV